jgi:squalene-hopene/tetraprenyl-beta-curcumene cyclase
MRTTFSLLMLLAIQFQPVPSSLFADDLTLETVTPTDANDKNEPLAASFSMATATRFLDQSSLEWTKTEKCFTCHTNFAYLMSRPSVSADNTAHRQVRSALEETVEKRWPSEGPRWDAEVIMSAAVLAMNDAATTGKLHPATKVALDRMWTVQRSDGGFDWLKCGWPPMESDDDFGIAIAALAVGSAPADYSVSEQAKKGIEGLRKYLKKNPPPTLHHQAMLVWAQSKGVSLLSEQELADCIEQIAKLQNADGGWTLARFGDWKRTDQKEQDTVSSDGYATGFAIVVLRSANVPSSDERIQRAIQWLKSNQRQSGRWFTRSLNQDGMHYLSHAGSAFAVMALASCGEK